MKKVFLLTLSIMGLTASAQQAMTPELLWKLGRVSAMGISTDGKSIVYKVSTPDVEENKSNTKYYTIPVTGGTATEIDEAGSKLLLKDKYISADGKWFLTSKEVKVNKVHGKDYYTELEKSNVQIYDGLDYRHWDTWNEGIHNHVGYTPVGDKENFTDIMKDEPYDSPQKPFPCFYACIIWLCYQFIYVADHVKHIKWAAVHGLGADFVGVVGEAALRSRVGPPGIQGRIFAGAAAGSFPFRFAW